MRTRAPLLLAALLPALLAGCDGGTTPSGVRIEAWPLPAEEARAASVAALETRPRGVRVRRVIPVADSCRRLSADVARTADLLTLRVVAHPGDTPCEPAEAYLTYTATVEGVRPGRYNLRVIHRYADNWRPGRTVLEHPVLVGREGDSAP